MNSHGFAAPGPYHSFTLRELYPAESLHHWLPFSFFPKLCEQVWDFSVAASLQQRPQALGF